MGANNIRALLKAAYDAASDKKGENIRALDISEISVVCDYFLIVTGNNASHIQALAEAVEEKLGKLGCALRHKEGLRTATWVLLDFNDIIVHLFNAEEREFYNLEHVWGDAKEVSLD